MEVQFNLPSHYGLAKGLSKIRFEKGEQREILPTWLEFHADFMDFCACIAILLQ